MMIAFVALLCVAVSGQCLTTCAVSASGEGPTSVAPMLKQWAFAYSLLKTNVGIGLQTVVDGRDAFLDITTPCRKDYLIDFLSSDLNYFRINGIGMESRNATMRIHPFFAGAQVMTYNIPSISSTTKLIFSRKSLYKIYTHQITWWNDSDITNDNPGVTLPQEKIRLVMQTQISGGTVVLTTLLSNYERENPTQPEVVAMGPHGNYTGTQSAINVSWYDQNTTVFAPNPFAAVSYVLTTNYSLGYAPLSYVDQGGLSYATLINKLGNKTDPTNDALAAALTAAYDSGAVPDILTITNINLTDSRGSGAYPMTSLAYLGYHSEGIETNCDVRRELWKFFNWILTADAAELQILNSVGYAPFSARMNKLVLAQVQNVTCQGKHLLDLEYKESSSTPLRQAALSISAIFATLTILVFMTLGWKRHNRITKAAGLAFASAFLLGCLFNYLSIFIWVLVPNSDIICSSRYILVALGYTLLLGAMFAKCWEIQKVFATARSTSLDLNTPFQELSWWQFCRVFFGVVGVNVLLLLILGKIDPPSYYVRVTDPLELYAEHDCYIKLPKAWLGVEFTYFGCLVLWGGYLSFQTRDIWEKYNYPNESKSILLSIYNLIFCIAILVPLSTSLSGNPEVVFFLTAAAILFPTSFALAMVYGPKLIVFLGSSFGKRSKDSAGGLHKVSKQGGHSGTNKSAKDGDKFEKEVQDNVRKPPKGDLRDEKMIIVEEDPREEHSDGGRHEGPWPQSPSVEAAIAPGVVVSDTPMSIGWRVLVPPETSPDMDNLTRRLDSDKN